MANKLSIALRNRASGECRRRLDLGCTRFTKRSSFRLLQSATDLDTWPTASLKN
jgi:hypothetical protein